MTTQSRTLHTGPTAEDLDRLTDVTTEASFLAQCFEKGDDWNGSSPPIQSARSQ